MVLLADCFTFSPAQWASPQLNGPVQNSSDELNTDSFTDRAMMAERQLQEKKSTVL